MHMQCDAHPHTHQKSRGGTKEYEAKKKDNTSTLCISTCIGGFPLGVRGVLSNPLSTNWKPQGGDKGMSAVIHAAHVNRMKSLLNAEKRAFNHRLIDQT